MVRCIIAGFERGEGFAQLWNFSNFLGTAVQPAPHACQPKNTAAKTPLRAKRVLRGAADEVENRSQVTSIVLYFVRVHISPYKPP